MTLQEMRQAVALALRATADRLEESDAALFQSAAISYVRDPGGTGWRIRFNTGFHSSTPAVEIDLEALVIDPFR